MIVTVTEAKAILNISVSTYDSFLKLHIPNVEQVICNYARTDFIDDKFDYFSSNDITFISSDNSINYTGIENKKLIAGDTIRVYKSFRNNYPLTVESVETNKIIIDDTNILKDEDENEVIYITKVTYPIPIKFVAAKLLNYDIQQNYTELTPGAKSEKIDDYQITFDEMFEGYPIAFLKPLNRYRQLYKRDLFNHRVRTW